MKKETILTIAVCVLVVVKDAFRNWRAESRFFREHRKELWHHAKHYVLWYIVACVALVIELLSIPYGMMRLSGIELYTFLTAGILVLAVISTIMIISIREARRVQKELKKRYNYQPP